MAQTELQPDSLRNMLIADWERAKAYTLEFVDAMPEEGFSFRPTEDIRSFAEQMLHLSQGNINLSSNGTQAERLYSDESLEKTEEYKSKEKVREFVVIGYDHVIEGIRNMDLSTLGEIKAAGPFNVTRLGWINKAFEHQTHHRGQCAIYLRLQGVTPPRSKLF